MSKWTDAIGLGIFALEIAEELARRSQRVVLAESCTGGLAAAVLASVPGISEYFCGSAVTYRDQTKMDWLGVSPLTLERSSAVSMETSRELVQNVLLRTPEADWSAAITGHLGPNAPPGRDGEVFVSIAKREGRRAMHVEDAQFRLQDASRPARQAEACQLMLSALLRCLRQG